MSARRFLAGHAPTVLLRLADGLNAELAARLQERAAGPVSLPRFRVLAALHDAPGGCERVTRLADLCGAQQPTMSKLLDAMAYEGLVERRQNGRDRRVVLVALTAVGDALAGEVVEIAALHEGDALGRLPSLAGFALPDALEAMERGDE